MAPPSIKGAAFKGVAEDYLELVRTGRITPEDQAKYLQPEDRPRVDELVPAIAWIPMETYCRVMELIARAEDARDALGDDEYVVVVSEARDFPDVALHTAQGFLEYLAETAHGGAVRVTARRVGPDRIECFLRSADDA